MRQNEFHIEFTIGDDQIDYDFSIFYQVTVRLFLNFLTHDILNIKNCSSNKRSEHVLGKIYRIADTN